MRFKTRKQKRELHATIERGRTLLMERDETALEYIEDAARRFPDSAEIRLLLASALLTSRPEDVRAQAATAAELGAEDPVIQVRAGDLLLSEGDLEAARVCATRAQETVDGEFILMADLEGLIGRIAARDGDYAVAEEKLRSALRREPEWPSHPIHLARFLWARERNEDALTVIDESLDRVRDKDHLERLRGEIASDD
jgi:tetratricopeptide (TPR) repeat protein